MSRVDERTMALQETIPKDKSVLLIHLVYLECQEYLLTYQLQTKTAFGDLRQVWGHIFEEGSVTI